MFFKSEVRAWFYDGEYTAFEDFSSAFVERFGPKVNKYAPLKKLLTIKKKSRESAREYGDRFRQWKVKHDKHAKKDPKIAALSDNDLLHQFLNGLTPKSLRQAVRSEGPKDLETAMKKAIELEDDEDDSFSDSDEGPAYRQQDSDSSPSEDEEKPLKSRKNRGKDAPTKDNAVEQLTKQIADMKIFLMNQGSSRRRCFNCQQSGHEAPQCPNPCKLCNGQEGTKGHPYYECTKYKPKTPPKKNFLINGEILPKEDLDTAMTVKRGHETATSDPGTSHVPKRVKVADLIHDSQIANDQLVFHLLLVALKK